MNVNALKLRFKHNLYVEHKRKFTLLFYENWPTLSGKTIKMYGIYILYEDSYKSVFFFFYKYVINTFFFGTFFNYLQLSIIIFLYLKSDFCQT